MVMSSSRRARAATGAPDLSPAYVVRHEGRRFVAVCLSDVPEPRAVGLLTALTTSEQEVAVLVTEQLSNAEIARRRGVAPRTIANQLASVYRKLGVGSRTELVALLARARSRARDPSV